MLFSLDVIRARKGDCLILHYGPTKKPRVIMIDGGPRGVYSPHLKPRINTIREKRGIKKGDPLLVDLLMVSHVDDDHIQGILDLTRELIDDKSNLVRVLNLWHNSFDNIIGNSSDELTASFNSKFTASTSGELQEGASIEPDDEELDDKTVVANLKVLASIPRGSQLRGDAKRLDIEPNVEFEGKLIMATENGEAVEIGPGLKFTVIGPMEPELENLRKKHEQWLIDLKAKGKSPDEALAAYVDRSVPNLSSIVVLAEAEAEAGAEPKRILLTGDALGNKILKGLELVGVIVKDGKLKVDVLKVPHHGSSNNLALDFFQRVIADHYVFSGNGEHGNPERESLQWLLDARGVDDTYTIHVTYPIAEIDAAREAEWNTKQQTEKNLKKKKVRADWSHEEHSLAALFAANPEFAEKLSIVGDGEPHVIDLLEKVGF